MKRVLCLIFVLAMCFCMFSCSCSNGDENTPKGMKLASNTKVVDYKLFVPEGWIVSNADRAQTQAYVSENDRTNIIVNQWNMTENTKTVADWWEKEYKPQVFKAGAVLDYAVEKNEDGTEGVNMLLGGKEAVKYTYTGRIGDAFFKYQVIGCVTNGSIYVMHITYLQDGNEAEGEAPRFTTVETHKSAIEQIIASFKFI